jgi:hypothetical protein
MDQNPTPGIPGQHIAPDMLTEILAAVRELGSRMASLEVRLEGLDRDVVDTANAESVPDIKPEPPRVPALALRSDGRVLLSLTYLEGANLEGREQWTGIILNEAEACDALDVMRDAAGEAAAAVGVHILLRGEKKDDPARW